MDFLLVFVLAGLSLSATAFVIDEETANTEEFEIESRANHPPSFLPHCFCREERGCWCVAVDDGLVIQADISLDEMRRKNCKKTVIYLTVYIGRKTFFKVFPVDRFEDFCETVNGKRFCFRIDVHDSGKSDHLNGCMRISRPTKIEMGCFELPLMAAGCNLEQERSNDIVMVDDLSIERPVDSMEETFEPYDMPEENEKHVMPSALQQMFGLSDEGHCHCHHGCVCFGEDDGLKVAAFIEVDEVNHCHQHRTLIDGYFVVGADSFHKRFPANQCERFCKEVNGKKFCFHLDVEDNGKTNQLDGCIGLTEPKEVHIGCFNLPLLTSCDDDKNSDDVTDDVVMPYIDA